jgi:DNA repair protein RadC
MARALIARFGTFAEAMNAPDELLREVPGIGEAAVGELKLVRAAAAETHARQGAGAPVLGS